MSRQEKNHTEPRSERENSELDKKTRIDKIITLETQAAYLAQENRSLFQTRNYAVIIAVVSTLCSLYLLFIKSPADDIAYQDAQVARQLNLQKQYRSKQPPKQKNTQPALTDEHLTDPAPRDLKISSVINRTDRKDLEPPKIQWAKKQDIYRMIHLWAVAWEIRDLPTYFAYYSARFDPQNMAPNIQQWKAKRSYLIDKPDNIKISIQNIDFKHLDDKTAAVTFNQHYTTPTYSDKSHKLLELVHENNRWLILRESAIDATNIDLKK